ncbi:LCP family protein [Bacillus sp. CGMCC 1.16607]|uniref:LCP family protein n=1 Tax=Bacillus sp. CGMCC 1.16607 TaxID=3351842 RepID=UPI0036446490
MRSEKHKKKRKKKKKLRGILFILLLLIGGIFAYSYFQYKQGIEKSSNDKNVPEQTKFEFHGDKDQFGGTNVLLLGSDAREKGPSRSDTIMIAHYHEDKGTFKVTSIMRDTYVDIPGHGQNRINTAFAFGGPDLLRQTIKENFDIDLQYYAIIDFQGFERVVDEAFPEGVKVDVEKKMDKSDHIGVNIEPGEQYLDGKHLLGYVRYRNDAIGDFGRVERQQKVVKEVADQLTSIQKIHKLPKLVGVVKPFINMNLKTTDILFMGKDFLSGNRGEIKTFRIPAEGSFSPERISGVGEVLAIDKEANQKALHEFIQQP